MLRDECGGKFHLEDLVVNGRFETIYVLEFKWLRMPSNLKTGLLYTKMKGCLEELSNGAH